MFRGCPVSFEELAPWACPRKKCGHVNSGESRKCGGCGAVVCGAKTRQKNEAGQVQVCRQTQVSNNGRCRLHGGGSLSGPAHPAYRHGRYWRVLPLVLQPGYAEADQDRNKLSMEPELAVLDARIGQLMTQLESGESSDAWSEIRSLVNEVVEARRARDLVKSDAALAELLQLVESPSPATVWADIYKLWDRRMRYVESERRRLLDAQMYVSVGHISQVFGALAESLRRNVRDPAERQGVVQTMRRLLGKSRPHALDEAV